MKFEPGFSGKDSMRSKAEAMFRDDIKAANKYEQPQSASSIGREKARPYAKGGHVKHHAMPGFQKDMKLPHRAKTPKLKIQSFEAAEKMAKGGRAERNAEIKHNAKSFGSKLGRSIGNAVAPGMTEKIVTKRINNGKFTAAKGGSVYTKEMVGEHPSRKRPHFNYEGDMMGAHAERKATHSSRIAKRTADKSHHQYAEGGHAFGKGPSNRSHRETKPMTKEHKFAMGGVGKIRHSVSDKSGQQNEVKQSGKEQHVLMPLRFVEEILKELRSERRACEEIISSGAFDKHSQYRFMAGKRMAALASEHIVIDTYKKMYESIEINKGVTNVREEFGDFDEET